MGERVLILTQADSRARKEMTLSELWVIVWREKWLVAATTLFGIALSIAYALLATQWYRAETTLIPAGQDAEGVLDSLGGLSGLADLAGIKLGAADRGVEPLAVLRSREFTRMFVEEQNLLPVLFADRWDAVGKRWKGSDPKKWPDLRDAVRLFDRKIRRISEDKASGLVTLTIEWTDPIVASTWANTLVDRLNARMRERALLEGTRNIEYLRQELGSSNVLTLQQSVARLLQNEMQKMMVARGSTEFAFRVIDHAHVPKWRSWPKRPLTVVVGSVVAGLFAIIVALWRNRLRMSRV